MKYPKQANIPIAANEFAFIIKGCVCQTVLADQDMERAIIFMGQNSLLGNGFIINAFIHLNILSEIYHLVGKELQFRCTTQTEVCIFKLAELEAKINQVDLDLVRENLFYDYASKSNQFMIMSTILAMPSSLLKVCTYLYIIYNFFHSKVIPNPGFSLYDISLLLAIHKSGFFKIIKKLMAMNILKAISKKEIVFTEPEKLQSIIMEKMEL